MLSEVLFAAVGTRRQAKEDRAPGLSISQLFPCPYKLYRAHIGEVFEEELEPREILNMEDGWDQEEQSIRRLKEKAGIIIQDRQAGVGIGKSNVPGRIDGTFTLNGKKRLWEHKAWGEIPFGRFMMFGLGGYPGVRAQVNGYMLGMGLDEVDVFIKKKDNNDYFDTIYGFDEKFILPIVEWCDKIRLENWVPEPQLCEYCSNCNLRCFGPVLDFSWIATADASEMVEKWKKGKAFKLMGEMMLDEARTYFVGKEDKYGNVIAKGVIGDRDLLIVEDLEVRKVVQHRFDIRKEKVLEIFGPEGLIKVGEERDITTYRIREV
jgi:hypothetical protein